MTADQSTKIWRESAWVHTVIAVSAFAVSMLLLWAYRLPRMELVTGLCAWLILWFVSCAWAVFFAALGLNAWLCRKAPPSADARKFTRRALCWAAATPLLLGLTYQLVQADLPRHLMFQANRQALEAFAKSYREKPLPEGTVVDVGGYQLFGIKPTPTGFTCLVGGCTFFRGGSGFAYSYTDAPTESAPINYVPYPHSFEKITPNWYYYHFDAG